MNNSLTSELKLISEWGRINRVDFDARQTQCCVLTHNRNNNAILSVTWGDVVNIKQSENLDVLTMKIQWDV